MPPTAPDSPIAANEHTRDRCRAPRGSQTGRIGAADGSRSDHRDGQLPSCPRHIQSLAYADPVRRANAVDAGQLTVGNPIGFADAVEIFAWPYDVPNAAGGARIDTERDDHRHNHPTCPMQSHHSVATTPP